MIILLFMVLFSTGAQNLLNEKTLKGKLPRGIEMNLSKEGASFRVTGGSRMIRYRIGLPANAKALNLTMLVRTKDCIRGNEGWKNARLDLHFIGQDCKRVGPWL